MCRVERRRKRNHCRALAPEFEKHAFPSLGSCLVCDIQREDVLSVLLPIWTDTPEAGRKLRRRMHAVFAWAKKRRFVDSNPAGEDVLALPKQNAVPDHIAALPHGDVSAALEAASATNGSDSAKLLLRFRYLRRYVPAKRGLPSGRNRPRGAYMDHSSGAHENQAGASGTVERRGADVLAQAEILKTGADIVFPSPRNPRNPLSDGTLKKITRKYRLGGSLQASRFPVQLPRLVRRTASRGRLQKRRWRM